MFTTMLRRVICPCLDSYMRPRYAFTMNFERERARGLWTEGVLLGVQEATCLDGKRIGYYRADSASYQAELFNQLEEDGVRCAITADQDKAVKSQLG